MRNKGFILGILVAAVAAGSVSAEEVIYFTNGTVMPIRAHVVEGDTIKVDLGDNGFMAFPKSVVERIEEAGDDVILMPSTSTNKMFASDPSTRVYGAAPRQSATSWALPTQMDADDSRSTARAVGGVLSVTPFTNDDHPAAKNLRINNVPELLRAEEVKQKDAIPGAPQKIPTNATRKKKAFTEFGSRD